MLDEEAFKRAQEKIKKAEDLADNQGLNFDSVAEIFYKTFKSIFDEVIEDELTYDETLAFAEKQLEIVYERYAEDCQEPIDAGETYHSENPNAEGPWEKLPYED